MIPAHIVAIALAAKQAEVIGFNADACVFICCEQQCPRLLVLAWSERQIDEAKDKARAAGWFVFRDADHSGSVFCPSHNNLQPPAVRS